MTIGIYKPFKKIYFHDLTDDYAAWSSEVTKLSTILANEGHEIFMLSETDLTPEYHQNIHVGDPTQSYERIIIFCGSFALDSKGDNIIKELRSNTSRLDFIITDLSLLPTDLSNLDLFDNIYSQAAKPMEVTNYKDQYGGLIEITAFGHEYTRTIDEAIDAKTIRYVFGGSERNRLKDFTEYIWRPDCLYYAKSDYFGFNTRVSRSKYMEDMEAAVASICIADIHYNDNLFVTHRPIECFLTDTVCFVDHKYDSTGTVIPLDSWLRVENYLELYDKINELKENPEHWKNILVWQRGMINNLTDGSFVYDKLK